MTYDLAVQSLEGMGRPGRWAWTSLKHDQQSQTPKKPKLTSCLWLFIHFWSDFTLRGSLWRQHGQLRHHGVHGGGRPVPRAGLDETGRHDSGHLKARPFLPGPETGQQHSRHDGRFRHPSWPVEREGKQLAGQRDRPLRGQCVHHTYHYNFDDNSNYNDQNLNNNSWSIENVRDLFCWRCTQIKSTLEVKQKAF